MRVPRVPTSLVSLLLASAGAGCAPPTDLLLSADATRAGALGDDGPRGALLVERQLRVRGDRVVDVDIVAAADDDGRALPGLAPVLLLHGGAAPPPRYHWLATHLASRGAVVVMPQFLFDLALFSAADADDAMAAVREVSRDDGDDLAGVVGDAPVFVMGHSLGGVAAAAVFERDPEVQGLVMLAAYPDPSSTPTRRDGAVLSLSGGSDGLVDVADVQAGVDAMAAPAIGGLVEGLTHYQLTDDATDAELAREGTTGDDLAVVRQRTLFLIDALRDAPPTVFQPTTWPAGLQPLHPESP